MVHEAPIMVRVENVSKSFGKFQVLNNVSFEIRKGEVLGFLGPNGAGKTTAVRILTGYFPPTQGRVWIGDVEVFKRPKDAKRRMGYLPEAVSLYPEMRVNEFLEFVARVKSVARSKRRAHLEDKLVQCGLWTVQHRLIGQLSKGFRQRVGLAQALVGDPDVLILDEPTTGLDPKQIIEIRTLINGLRKDRTLILSTHILPEVSMVCDRVLIINQGRIVASGTTEELEDSLKERTEILVAMGDPGRKEEALRLLEALPGVERVHLVEEKKEQITFLLTMEKGQDLRPVVIRLFVRHQLPLLEIRSGRLSLEEIFMKIVVNENTNR